MIKHYTHILFSKLADKANLNAPQPSPFTRIPNLELNYSLYKRAMDDLFSELTKNRVEEIRIQYSLDDSDTPHTSLIENPYQTIPVNDKTLK